MIIDSKFVCYLLYLYVYRKLRGSKREKLKEIYVMMK